MTGKWQEAAGVVHSPYEFVGATSAKKSKHSFNSCIEINILTF